MLQTGPWIRLSALFVVAVALILDARCVVRAQADLPPCNAVRESPLGALAGSWIVQWRYRTAPGEFAASEARAEIQIDLLGCAITERFSGTLRELPYAAFTMISALDDGRYDRVRIDSEHGSFTQSSGHAVEDSIVFTWERDLGSRVLRTRHVFTDFADSTFTVDFFMSPRDGAPWELVQAARYRRSPSPPSP